MAMTTGSVFIQILPACMPIYFLRGCLEADMTGMTTEQALIVEARVQLQSQMELGG